MMKAWNSWQIWENSKVEKIEEKSIEMKKQNNGNFFINGKVRIFLKMIFFQGVFCFVFGFNFIDI